MTWQALLRVVDFQELLTSQATFAEALEHAGNASGGEVAETQALREGFNLLAKVLFTQRATTRDVHDLAWLDHIVVSKELGPAKTWRGEHSRESFERLAGNRGRLGELIPGRSSTWASVPLSGVAGLGSLKLECGTAGSIRSGVVPQDALLELVSELTMVSPRTEEAREILGDAHRLAVAGRRVASESAALVFASAVEE